MTRLLRGHHGLLVAEMAWAMAMSLNHAQVVMGDLGQGSQAVGTRGIADNIEEVILFMVHAHHKYGGSLFECPL